MPPVLSNFNALTMIINLKLVVKRPSFKGNFFVSDFNETNPKAGGQEFNDSFRLVDLCGLFREGSTSPNESLNCVYYDLIAIKRSALNAHLSHNIRMISHICLKAYQPISRLIAKNTTFSCCHIADAPSVINVEYEPIGGGNTAIH